MALNKHFLIAAATLAYALILFAGYDSLHDSTLIPSIALLGLCGWFYGCFIGLVLLIPSILLNAGLLMFTSGHSHTMWAVINPVGILTGMAAVIAAGSLKASYDQVNRLRSSLAAHLQEATDELETLTRQLIERDEQNRLLTGQDLHDGVGQYLTSMLLHSDALTTRLRKAGQVELGPAEQVHRRIEKTIRTVRQLSRSLLPIRLSETSFANALGEMAAYFSEYSKSEVTLTCHGNIDAISASTAQHLHRITHEVIYRTICKYGMTRIHIILTASKHHCRVIIKGSEAPDHTYPFPDLVSEVMKYRIEAMNGHHTVSRLTKNGFRLECSIPMRRLYEHT